MLDVTTYSTANEHCVHLVGDGKHLLSSLKALPMPIKTDHLKKQCCVKV